jgi:hypothetical protein
MPSKLPRPPGVISRRDLLKAVVVGSSGLLAACVPQLNVTQSNATPTSPPVTATPAPVRPAVSIVKIKDGNIGRAAGQSPYGRDGRRGGAGWIRLSTLDYSSLAHRNRSALFGADDENKYSGLGNAGDEKLDRPLLDNARGGLCARTNHTSKNLKRLFGHPYRRNRKICAAYVHGSRLWLLL